MDDAKWQQMERTMEFLLESGARFDARMAILGEKLAILERVSLRHHERIHDVETGLQNVTVALLDLTAKMAETDRRMAETDRQIAENGRQIAENGRLVAETSRNLDRWIATWGGRNGHPSS